MLTPIALGETVAMAILAPPPGAMEAALTQTQATVLGQILQIVEAHGEALPQPPQHSPLGIPKVGVAMLTKQTVGIHKVGEAVMIRRKPSLWEILAQHRLKLRQTVLEVTEGS
jgi:hypothetical protein